MPKCPFEFSLVFRTACKIMLKKYASRVMNTIVHPWCSVHELFSFWYDTSLNAIVLVVNTCKPTLRHGLMLGWVLIIMQQSYCILIWFYQKYTNTFEFYVNMKNWYYKNIFFFLYHTLENEKKMLVHGEAH